MELMALICWLSDSAKQNTSGDSAGWDNGSGNSAA